jgi:hypothetical protein
MEKRGGRGERDEKKGGREAEMNIEDAQCDDIRFKSSTA